MSRLIRLIVAGLLSIGLAVAVLPALQPPVAQADTTVAAAKAVHRVKLSPTRVKAVKLIARARVDAMNKSGSVMNYAKMRKVFKGKKHGTNWRRQMAAGARQAGTKITHISAAESREVERVRKEAWPGCPACLLASDSAKREPPSDSCGEGVSKHVTHNPLLHKKWQFSHYLNSCETNELIGASSTCVLWAGVASGLLFIPGAKALGAATALASAFCGTDVIWFTVAQNNSDIGAIIIRYGKWINIPKGGAVRDVGFFSQ